ncbi:LytR family transcriptional regulator [Eggerthellaceae bacterium zg-887]|uniref:LCP family protein n=1 Tax=Xiamenia xianingshaonis TaxID=2682776 RepID=UPI00140CE5BA|nr:LCP family protein [Xiamenia xianingshaonis]NHM16027.1 LytR family transcriptional regulator [Xiamenia xianingshaonis]
MNTSATASARRARWAALVAVAVACVLLAALTACAKSNSPTAVRDTDMVMNVRDVDMMAGMTGPDTDPFWVLVVGSDTREGTADMVEGYEDLPRSDTIMLVRVDPQNYSIGLVTVPRDTTAYHDDGWVMKINDAYLYDGVEGLAKQVYSLTGVDPKYYLVTTFVTFENLVNALGGVDVNVPIDMHLKDVVSGGNIELSAGDQHLDGAEALVLARVRKLYAEYMDVCRQIQDRNIVQSLIAKVAANPDGVTQAVQDLTENTTTNWPTEKLFATVTDFAQHADQISFLSGTGPYDGDFDENAGGMWLAYRDEDTWAKIIAAVEAGTDPTTILSLPEVVPVEE